MSVKQSFVSILLTLAVCFSSHTFAQSTAPVDKLPDYFNAITLEDINSLTEEQWSILKAIPSVIVVRVVFNKDTKPEDYSTNLSKLHSMTFPDSDKRKVYVVGEFLDSDFLARYRWDCKPSDGCTTDENRDSKFLDYKTRIDSYLSVLDKDVDVWEVGNEVNGEWADEGCVKKVNKNGSDGGCFSDVKQGKDGKGNKGMSMPIPLNTARKIQYAIVEVQRKKKPIALTLIHQPECTTWDKNTMFEWANTNLKPLIDGYKINYLLISYYEDNCDQGKKTIAPKDSLKLTKAEKKSLSDEEKDQRRRNIYWNPIFDDLGKLFSNVEHIGFGEVGYSSDMKTCETNNDDKILFCKVGNLKGDPAGSKLTLLKRYYGMTITNPKYIGGHFWWTAQEDITYSGFYKILEDYFSKHK
ncbi:MAG: hypothetical protein QOJ02_1990 [Acidobacteriota bacterium]|jgi:hypothetical protein|nr:hypothetical protein [Acidobacteriota bacterium]